tara:strand:+ start:1061 stop:1894 length:834 start_codon:yes stop_codon:yes gene_type:complete
MFGHQYYNQVIRRYVVMFGTLFNDIIVQRFNKAGQRIQALKVPIAYGPKEKFLVRITQDPELTNQSQISLPRMGFEMTGMSYMPERKLSSTQRRVNTIGTTGSNNSIKTVYTPVPYDFNFSLSVFVKNADDGVQILEQILPFFTPEWTTTLKIIPEMNIKHDVPTVLQSVTTEDAYEGDFETRRSLIYNLDFLVKGYIYGPVKKSGIIKRTMVDFINSANTELQQGKRIEKITVTPGLDANGNPTANSSQSISIDNISANDNYGFAIDFETDLDGEE